MIQVGIVIDAKRLLYYTNKSVKQITYELGFEDPAYFGNFFKRHTSLSPLEFRNDRDTASIVATQGSCQSNYGGSCKCVESQISPKHFTDSI